MSLSTVVIIFWAIPVALLFLAVLFLFWAVIMGEIRDPDRPKFRWPKITKGDVLWVALWVGVALWLFGGPVLISRLQEAGL